MNFLRKSYPLLRRSIVSKIPSHKPHSPSPPLFTRPIFNPNLHSTNKLFSIKRIPNPFSQRRRFYHSYEDEPEHWYHNFRAVLIVIVVSSGAILTIYFGRFETVPCTKRSHLILISPSFERFLGEDEFKELKKKFKDKILPANHPDSVRVSYIANRIIKALQRGLQHDKQLRSTSEVSSKATKKKVSVPQTNHLEGLNWEVLVVKDNSVNAFCLPGGKIVVYTGLLHHFKKNAEIATVLGHEVAHVTARHGAETITKNLWLAVIRIVFKLILLEFDMPDLVNEMSTFLLQLPFSRRMEIEADYIGLLLMASAGYDPHVAPRVYEKLGQINKDSALDDYTSTHPSSMRRVKMLSQAQVMERAVSVHKDAVAGHGVSGFL
ncbi:mitochondrial metalloendopeptidase OMA1-like [Dioscorea cayenensis subsp. rotundata]|uniref:Mitochondrial metalloendopeptidase OMA1-like n=1 Tax=Dioscorea cayennensis subsp. rotundata TaxID=55577 RepID=A0AB40D3G0_DIOCR|nr:mitochondrial metalloendopeptidase OMA1-like [Dioscorea cayenensis subsp. rotundata]